MSEEDDSTASNDVLPESGYRSDHDRLVTIEGLVTAHHKAIGQIQKDIRWAVKKVLGIVIVAILGGVVVKSIPQNNSSPNQPLGAKTGSASTRSHAGQPLPASLPSSSDNE